jgi:hypothetical protein
MDGEYILGSKISVRHLNKERGFVAKNLGMIINEFHLNGNLVVNCYCNRDILSGSIITRNRAVSESEIVTNSKQSGSKQMYTASASVLGTRTLQYPHYQSSSSVMGAYPAYNAHCAPINVQPSGLV